MLIQSTVDQGWMEEKLDLKNKPPFTPCVEEMQTHWSNITLGGQLCRNQIDWFYTSDWVHAQMH